MAISHQRSANHLAGGFRVLLVVVAAGLCAPLTGKQFGEPVAAPIAALSEQEHRPAERPSTNAAALVSFTESVTELSQRTGPPSAFRTINHVQVLPLSHHSLWNRLRVDFEFAELEHPKIDLQIEFLQNGMRSLHANLSAARPYLRYIVEQVERAGMPIDIAMLPLVESAFNPHAKSSQNALGLWQFIPDTGKLYGLDENDWYSGRKDIVASTEAALKYLRRLHQIFDGDWLLALAAYNTGQGNVRSAIRRAKKSGLAPVFWNLRLAKETRDYVPRLIAVSKMILEPEAYGVILPPLPDRKTTRTVSLDGAISMQEAANISGIGIQRLLELNPGYKQLTLPPEGPHRLLIPIEGAASLIDWNEAQRLATAAATGVPVMASDTSSMRQSHSFKKVAYKRYKVRKGDNLWNIAQQLDTDLEALTTWNFISGNSKPLQPGDELWYAALDSDAATAPDTKLIRYRVVTSDTLSILTDKFNTRLAELKKWNRSLLYSHSLRPGQILYIPTH